MFTGIVEEMAKIEAIEKEKSNTHFTLSCSFVDQLKIDQSVAHDGVCLTVIALTDQTYTVTAIEETLGRSNLNGWEVGDAVNLERCIKLSDRLDGHMVQGHVDQVGTVEDIIDEDGSFKIYITYEAATFVTVEKGSICVNGVSLTVVDSDDKRFSVAVIPYTWEHTNLGRLKKNDQVNLEFDILGKYVQKLMEKRT
jgi:riboflavin synthase